MKMGNKLKEKTVCYSGFGPPQAPGTVPWHIYIYKYILHKYIQIYSLNWCLDNNVGLNFLTLKSIIDIYLG